MVQAGRVDYGAVVAPVLHLQTLLTMSFLLIYRFSQSNVQHIESKLTQQFQMGVERIQVLLFSIYRIH